MNEPGFGIHEILKRLPHRYPFLLVDRVLSFVPGESLEAIKNVTFNEPFFTGHFPERPVMPGVLIIESLAQACGILNFKTHNVDFNTNHNVLFYLVGIENCRFKRVVEPGDQLHLHVKKTKHKQDLWKFDARAEVGGELACTVEIICVTKDMSK
jgi:3-hydroxyacyl-[acyl-carrier-protein] dehydratase